MHLFTLLNNETSKRTFMLFVNSISSTNDPLTKSMVGTMISEKFISGGMSGTAVLAIQLTHFTCDTWSNTIYIKTVNETSIVRKIQDYTI